MKKTKHIHRKNNKTKAKTKQKTKVINLRGTISFEITSNSYWQLTAPSIFSLRYEGGSGGGPVFTPNNLDTTVTETDGRALQNLTYMTPSAETTIVINDVSGSLGNAITTHQDFLNFIRRHPYASWSGVVTTQSKRTESAVLQTAAVNVQTWDEYDSNNTFIARHVMLQDTYVLRTDFYGHNVGALTLLNAGPALNV